jgi:hypothetical protein
MPEDYKTNTNFSQSSPGENGSVDPIRQSVTDKSAAFINKGLEEFQRPSFGTEILTGNSTELF